MELSIVLVNPLYGGNIGSVVRVMANFGVSNIFVVGSYELDDESYKMSMHGRDLLETIQRFDSLTELPVDIRIGTTGRTATSPKKENRHAHTPEEALEAVAGAGNVAIVFGPEDKGLSNEEVSQCDIISSIPANPDYPILNISQAVCIYLYEFSRGKWVLPGKEMATAGEVDLLMGRIRGLLDDLPYEDARRERVEVYFRRLLGRAGVTKWEFHGLMGFFADIEASDPLLKRRDPP